MKNNFSYDQAIPLCDLNASKAYYLIYPMIFSSRLYKAASVMVYTWIGMGMDMVSSSTSTEVFRIHDDLNQQPKSAIHFPWKTSWIVLLWLIEHTSSLAMKVSFRRKWNYSAITKNERKHKLLHTLLLIEQCKHVL